MSPTRRTFLERFGLATATAAAAGCAAFGADDTPSESPTDNSPPTTAPSPDPTPATSDSGPSPSTAATDADESTPAGRYTVTLALERTEYRLAARPEPNEHLPVADATALSTLEPAVSKAVRTAIEGDRFETEDPSTTLLNGIDALGLVAADDTYYTLSHTFTEYILNLALDVDPDTVPAENVVTRESDVVHDHPSVAAAVDTITPYGTSKPSQEYRTLVMTEELATFIDSYDYVSYGAGVGRLEYAVERQHPPFTLSAREATEKARYGRPVVEASSFAPGTRSLVRETLETHRRTPIRLDDEHRRVGALRLDSVPYELEQGVRRGHLLRVDGSLYHFRVGHAHWDQQPMELAASLDDGTVGADDPATLRLAATNASDRPARMEIPGLLPFGILWAAPTAEDAEPVQLWSDDYERSDLVAVEDGVARPDSYRHDRFIAAGETVTQQYTFGEDLDAVAATDYSVWGVLWVRWPSHDTQRERDWNADIYPYELRLQVEPV